MQPSKVQTNYVYYPFYSSVHSMYKKKKEKNNPPLIAKVLLCSCKLVSTGSRVSDVEAG